VRSVTRGWGKRKTPKIPSSRIAPRPFIQKIDDVLAGKGKKERAARQCTRPERKKKEKKAKRGRRLKDEPLMRAKTHDGSFLCKEKKKRTDQK